MNHTAWATISCLSTMLVILAAAAIQKDRQIQKLDDQIFELKLEKINSGRYGVSKEEWLETIQKVCSRTSRAGSLTTLCELQLQLTTQPRK